MKFRSMATEEVHVNLTPLIDVVFLLLIFFMVTTTFNRYAELKIQLPEATTDPQQKQEILLDLVIDSTGRYYINGQAVVNTQAKTLTAALHRAIEGNLDPTMVIRADARTPHQSVVTALDSANRVGVSRLSIDTTQIQGPP